VKIPKLRFKPKNGGIFPAWSEKTLAELTDVFKSGQGITSNRIRAEGEYPVYGGNGLRGYAEEFTHDGYYALIGRQGALCGNINTVDGKTFISEHAIAVKATQDSSTEWLAIKLELMNLNRLSESSAQPGLAVNKLLKLKVNAPCIEEQEKIAAFIGAIDQKISLLSKKHELLIQYKKGVMRKIFNQEIRFRDEGGEDFPEWRPHKFNEIYDFYPTNSLSREMLNYEAGDVFNIHYGDIHTKFKTRFELKNEVVPFVNEGALGVKVKPDSYCRPGDLVIADASEDYKDVGKAIEIIDVGNKKITAGLHTYIARDKNLQMALGFGGCLMQSAPVRRQIKFLATGTSVLSISKTNLSKIDLLIPSKSEQKAISVYSAKFDKKIEIIKSQLELTKKYKQGLLQQMFI
jgi:type I restriction enzyme S subunit